MPATAEPPDARPARVRKRAGRPRGARRDLRDWSDLRSLKARVDLRDLVQATHELKPSGKVHCPFHDDAHPSCHIYRDGFKCFACGAYGDQIDWLRAVRGLGMAEAVAMLREHAGAAPPPPVRERPGGGGRQAAYTPVSESAARRYRRLLATTARLPAALEGRGLDLPAAHLIGLAALGEDALIPLFGPDGQLLALKRRFHAPDETGSRYTYTTGGHGSPPWCSPAPLRAPSLLLIEGELNGAVSWLALREAGARVDVMAPGGEAGGLHPEPLHGKDVFIYADPDPPGDRARARWQREARLHGAASVRQLPAWPQDACELAEAGGRAHLARLLLRAMFELEGVTPSRPGS